MNPYVKIIVVGVALAVLACGGKKEDSEKQEQQAPPEPEFKNTVKLTPLKWLEGKWVENLPADISGISSPMQETWKYENDELLSGKGIQAGSAGTTGFEETLRIFVQKDTVYYAPTVPSQNNGKEILYHLVTELSSDSLVFENKTHDFPQTITYVKRNDSSLFVTLSGMENNEPFGFSIDFIRAKPEN